MFQRIALDELEPNESFLQSRYWAELKRRFGWVPHAVREPGERSTPFHDSALALTRRIAPGFSLAYLPQGPELRGSRGGVSEQDEVPTGGGGDREAELIASLRGVGQELAGAIELPLAMVRFDPSWEFEIGPAIGGVEQAEAARAGAARDAARRSAARRAGLRRPGVEIQPRATVLIDLTQDEEALLGAMKSKWRYNIRLAAKRGVTVEHAGIERLGAWYELYRETAERDRIAIHSEEYYRAVFELAVATSDSPDIKLLLAGHDGELLAGIVVASYRGRATYLYGAASNRKRNLMPAYALQWEAMRKAKAAGMRVYDLFGIPRSSTDRHRMQGLYRFKTGFGGRIVERPGCLDLPLQPLRYRAFRALERARAARARLRKPRR